MEGNTMACKSQGRMKHKTKKTGRNKGIVKESVRIGRDPATGRFCQMNKKNATQRKRKGKKKK